MTKVKKSRQCDILGPVDARLDTDHHWIPIGYDPLFCILIVLTMVLIVFSAIVRFLRNDILNKGVSKLRVAKESYYYGYQQLCPNPCP